MTQSTQSLGFHISKCEDARSSEAVGFHLAPNAFPRIQFRTIARQPIEAQLPPVAPDFLADLIGLMSRVAIPNQKHGSRGSNHQAIQKPTHHFAIYSAFFNHEPYSALPIHDAEQVQPMPRARRTHHGRLSLKAPSCSRMIIASQPRFVCKPDLRSQSFGFLSYRWVLLLDPISYPLGILLIRAPQRLLGSDSQLCQQTSNRIGTEPNPISLIDQACDSITRPQGKRKFILPRIATNHDPIDPPDHAPIQFARSASSLAYIQSIPSTGTVHRQPVIDASAVKPHRTNNNFRALPALNPSNSSFSKFGQYFMLQLPTIDSFLFHGRYYI